MLRPSGVYQTDTGLIFRVSEADDHLSVEVLKEGKWLPGRVGMVGLRLSASTRELGPEAILELPP